MKRLSTRPAALKLAFLVALVIALAFALRLGVGVLYWNANQTRPIEPWMPIGYVARSWDIPPDILAQALNIEQAALPRQSLERIAAGQGVPVTELIARLDAAIAAHHGAPP
jgi:hypothetical protein